MYWTDKMEETLIEALVHQVVVCGKRADSGYKKEAWKYACEQVQEVAGSAMIMTEEKCKSKHDSFKKDWKTYITLIEQSGFGVDENGVVTGDPIALENYFEKHPEAKKFKTQALKYADELHKLFAGVVATGENVFEIDSDDDELRQPSMPILSVERSQSLVASTKSERASPAIERKRCGTVSVEQNRGSRKRKPTLTDRLGQHLSGIAEQIAALVATLQKDSQREAIIQFMSDFDVLHPALKLTVLEVFSSEYSATSFTCLNAEMRKKWVIRELRKRRESLTDLELDGESFDSLIGEVEWSGGGVLARKNETAGVSEREPAA